MRLQSRVVHVSLSPRNPRRGSICCSEGTSFVADFLAAGSSATISTSNVETQKAERWSVREGGEREEKCLPKGAWGSDVRVASSMMSRRALGESPKAGALNSCVDGGDISAEEDDDNSLSNTRPHGCAQGPPAPTKRSHRGVAKLYQIWDPSQQTGLFSVTCSTASTAAHHDPSMNASGAGNDSEPCSGRNQARKCADGSGEGDAEFDAVGGCWEGRVPFAGGLSGVGSGVTGIGGGCKSATRIPVQAGRVAWCQDGKSLFLLSHEGEPESPKERRH